MIRRPNILILMSDEHLDLEPGYMTFARLFTRYAYETVAFGKLHHQGPDQMRGWLQRPVRHLDFLLSGFVEGWREEESVPRQLCLEAHDSRARPCSPVGPQERNRG